MNRLPEIKWYRLLLAFGITFIIADTYPHPQLPPGFLQSAATSLTKTGKAAVDSLIAHRSDRTQSAEPMPGSGIARLNLSKEAP